MYVIYLYTLGGTPPALLWLTYLPGSTSIDQKPTLAAKGAARTFATQHVQYEEIVTSKCLDSLITQQ